MAPFSTSSDIAPIEEIVVELRAGRMVILVDEEDRENEGDLVLAAEFVTPEAINFMAKHARGLICLTLTQERCAQLNLPLMTSSNRSGFGTNFTLSIEAAEGVTTGISAQDRSATILALLDPDATPSDFLRPRDLQFDPFKRIHRGRSRVTGAGWRIGFPTEQTCEQA